MIVSIECKKCNFNKKVIRFIKWVLAFVGNKKDKLNSYQTL